LGQPPSLPTAERGDAVIDRRVFLNGLASSLLLTPTTAGAQPASKTPRIGFLGLASAVSHAPRTEAFRAGLRDLGYIEGRNILIEFRWADGHYDRLPELATELVRPSERQRHRDARGRGSRRGETGHDDHPHRDRRNR